MDNAAQVEFDDALARVFAKVDRASKDAKNPHLNNKYATLAAVDDACREALVAEDFSWPQPVTTRRTEAGALEVVITTMLRRKGVSLTSELPMPVGGKGSAQEIGSAITYGRRYALSALLGVCTEDDDGHAASQRREPERGRDRPRGEGKRSQQGPDEPRRESKPADAQDKGATRTSDVPAWVQNDDMAQAYRLWRSAGQAVIDFRSRDYEDAEGHRPGEDTLAHFRGEALRVAAQACAVERFDPKSAGVQGLTLAADALAQDLERRKAGR